MRRIKFIIDDYPNFKNAYEHDGCDTWDKSLINAGFKSANYDRDSLHHSLLEVEFNWFVLKWK